MITALVVFLVATAAPLISGLVLGKAIRAADEREVPTPDLWAELDEVLKQCGHDEVLRWLSDDMVRQFKGSPYFGDPAADDIAEKRWRERRARNQGPIVAEIEQWGHEKPVRTVRAQVRFQSDGRCHAYIDDFRCCHPTTMGNVLYCRFHQPLGGHIR